MTQFTIQAALSWAKDTLRTAIEPQWQDLATPELDAEILLAAVLKKTRTELFTHPESIVPTLNLERFQKFIARRNGGEPIAYILGKKEFFGLEFFVDKNVLIPRPETEILGEKVLSFLKPYDASTILDIGTGSGIIAIALAKNLSEKHQLYALDISPAALRIAQKNAVAFRVNSHIEFICSDLLKDFIFPTTPQSPLVIVANLPYVPEGDELPPTVRDFEPASALFSGRAGTDIYQRFFTEFAAGIFVQNSKKVFCDICFFEFHLPQQPFWQKFLPTLFPDATLEFFSDLSGKTRFGILRIS